jgi:hypothetical protein
MCDCFSCVTEGDGILKYFNWKQRQLILKGKLFSLTGQSISNADSHSEICSYYNLDCDKVNKYEYNFLTKEFKIDQINLKQKNDSETCKVKVKRLKVKKIIEPLIIKKIIDPTTIQIQKIEIDDAIDLLKQWESVWESVGASVWASVWESVGASVRASVRASVWESVWVSVRESVWESVGESVRESVWVSVRESVGESVRAYISSFFDIKYKFDFSSCIKLWESGYVPSFDSQTWRLHGYKGKMLWEGKYESKHLATCTFRLSI